MGRFIRRGYRVAAKVMTKAKQITERLAKPDEIDLLLDEMRGKVEQSGNEIAGKVVVITGSTRGIGRAVAEGFAEKGASIVVNGRNAARVADTVAAIRSRGGTAEGAAVDVTSRAGAQRLLEDAIGAFGRVDVLINNAAVAGPTDKRAWQLSSREIEETIEIDLLGPFHCATTFVDWMIKNGVAGRVINVSSGAGETAVAKMAPYGIAKFGIEGLTKYLASDLGPGTVTVVTMQPGSILTDMTTEVFGWDRAQQLPPAEAVVPSFLFAATAPGEFVHGRAISVSRHGIDEFAEARLASPLAAVPPMRLQPIIFKGVPVDRESSEIVVFDRAENQFGMAPEAAQAIEAAGRRRRLQLYPDVNYSRLRRALAAEHDLSEDCFVVANGSSELIQRLLQIFVRPGEQTISNNPGWFGFDVFAARLGIDSVRVMFELAGPANRPHHSLEAMLRAIDVRTRLIYVINPSNPEGVPLRSEEFLAFLERVPVHIPVIVDEAYFEYADDPGIFNTARSITQTDRMLIGLRTFSKFYGLAGLRVGYGFARPEVANLLRRLELPFNISSVAEEAAVAALGARAFRERMHNSITQERQRIEQTLGDIRLDFIPSQTATMLVEAPGNDAARFYERYESEGIFLPRGLFFGNKYTLFPVGTEEQNIRNLAILRSLV